MRRALSRRCHHGLGRWSGSLRGLVLNTRARPGETHLPASASHRGADAPGRPPCVSPTRPESDASTGYGKGCASCSGEGSCGASRVCAVRFLTRPGSSQKLSKPLWLVDFMLVAPAVARGLRALTLDLPAGFGNACGAAKRSRVSCKLGIAFVIAPHYGDASISSPLHKLGGSSSAHPFRLDQETQSP